MWPYVVSCFIITGVALSYAIRTKIQSEKRLKRIKLKLELVRRNNNAAREFEEWRRNNPKDSLRKPEPKRLLHRCESAYHELVEYFPEFRNPEREAEFKALDL